MKQRTHRLTTNEKGEVAAAIRARIAFIQQLYQQHSIDAEDEAKRLAILRSALNKLSLQ